MASDLRTILIVREETRCRHISSLIDQQQGFFYMHRPTDKMITYHGLCYTSHGALAGTRNSSMGPPHEGSTRWPIAPWANALPQLCPAPTHRQDNIYHSLCYTCRGALAGTRNSSMGPPHEGSTQQPIAPWANALPLSYVPLLPTDRTTHTMAFVTPVVEHWLEREIAQWVYSMKDRSDDPSHHERTLYLWATSRSYPQTGQHIPQPLLHLSWSTGWNEK